LGNTFVPILKLGVPRGATYHWGVLNGPKNFAVGPMNMALSKKSWLACMMEWAITQMDIEI